MLLYFWTVFPWRGLDQKLYNAIFVGGKNQGVCDI